MDEIVCLYVNIKAEIVFIFVEVAHVEYRIEQKNVAWNTETFKNAFIPSEHSVQFTY